MVRTQLEQVEHSDDSRDRRLGWLVRQAALNGIETAKREYVKRAVAYGRDVEEAEVELREFEQLLAENHREALTAPLAAETGMARTARFLAVVAGCFVVADLAWSGLTMPVAFGMGLCTSALALAAVRLVTRR